MCLILIALGQHPDFPLIVAANRDEYHERPTRALHFWEEHPAILAGKDLKEGGTWLGVDRAGRLAAVTNLRSANHSGSSGERARGQLVKEFLAGKLGAEDYVRMVAAERERYGAFHLVLFARGSLFVYGSYLSEPVRLEAGIHGISNGPLDDPWPRALRGLAGMKQIVTSAAVSHTQAYLELLDSRNLDAASPAGQPARDSQSTVPDLPVFVTGEHYGTRCSSVILQTATHHVSFSERIFDAEGAAGELREFHYQAEG